MNNPLPSVAECRSILGTSADALTDEQVQAERDHLAELANVLFDQFRMEAKRDPDALRYLLDAHRHGIDSDADLYTGGDDPNEWAISESDGLYTDETLAWLQGLNQSEGEC